MTGATHSGPGDLRPHVGDLLPEITLPTLDGDAVRLDGLRGRRVVLFFWGSW